MATYLDYNASAPIRPEAAEAAMRAMRLGGNPSSVHAAGRGARALLEQARAEVAALTAMPAGSVIAFACEAGKEALDGASVASTNGVFTTALLGQLDKDKPTHVDTLFIRVTRAVEDATEGMQIPWHNHSLREENVSLF